MSVSLDSFIRGILKCSHFMTKAEYTFADICPRKEQWDKENPGPALKVLAVQQLVNEYLSASMLSPKISTSTMAELIFYSTKSQAVPIKLAKRGTHSNMHGRLCLAVGKGALCDLFCSPWWREGKMVTSRRYTMIRRQSTIMPQAISR